MKIFIDSANIEEIRNALSAGLAEGVTTNPSLIRKAVESSQNLGKTNLEEYLKDIAKLCTNIPLSIEISATSYLDMVREAKIIQKKFGKFTRVYVKIPISTSLDGKKGIYDALRTIRYLSENGIKVNATLIFTPEQALLAANAGAEFVSLFAGREDDLIRRKASIKFNKKDYFPKEGINGIDDEGIISGADLIRKTHDIFRIHKIDAKIIAASIRNRRQFRDMALSGADIATVPFEIIDSLITHENTLEGVKQFNSDILKEYYKIMEN